MHRSALAYKIMFAGFIIYCKHKMFTVVRYLCNHYFK